MKLGPHHILRGDDSWARVAPVLKAVGDPGILTVAREDAVRIFRRVWDEAQQDEILRRLDHDRVHREILDALGGYRHPRLYVEALNEVPKSWRGQYIELLALVVPRLHEAGLKVAGPSWATGDYETEDWDAFRAVGWCDLDLIALHAYWSTRGQTRWNASRWGTYWSKGDPPVVVTECGRDRVRDGDAHVNEGWLPLDNSGKYGYAAGSQQVTADAFIEELAVYDRVLEVMPEVVGATPFTCGPTRDWADKGFDMDPLVPRLAARFGGAAAVVPDVKPAKGVDVSEDFVVGQGFRKFHLVLGAPIEHERYHDVGSERISIALFERGYCTYRSRTNETVGIHEDGRIWTDRGNRGDGVSIWRVV